MPPHHLDLNRNLNRNLDPSSSLSPSEMSPVDTGCHQLSLVDATNAAAPQERLGEAKRAYSRSEY